jgi:hypothetical protein
METIRTDSRRRSRTSQRPFSNAVAPVEDHKLLPVPPFSYAVAPVEDHKLLPTSTRFGSGSDSYGATAVEDHQLLLRKTSFYLNGRVRQATGEKVPESPITDIMYSRFTSQAGRP